MVLREISPLEKDLNPIPQLFSIPHCKLPFPNWASING